MLKRFAKKHLVLSKIVQSIISVISIITTFDMMGVVFVYWIPLSILNFLSLFLFFAWGVGVATVFERHTKE